MGANTLPFCENNDLPQTPAGEALDSIRTLVRILRTSAVAADQSTGLSGAQLFVLQQLAESEATSINELADRTLTDQSSVSTVVSRLESKGLVERARSEEDARRVMVRITETGIRLLKESPPTIQTKLIHVLRTMQPASLKALIRELTHIIDALGASHEPPSLFFEDDATRST